MNTSPTKNHLEPVQEDKRIVVFDAIRGFALFGIMFVNMTWFTGYAVLSPNQKQALSTHRIDEFANWMIEVFVAGKFWTIFAFMFGLGIAIQLKKFENDSGRMKLHFIRRLSILLLFGLIHGCFLWFGDIVSLYAAAGFALILFIRCSDKTKLIWGFTLLLLPIIQVSVWLLIATLNGSAAGLDPGHGPAELLPVFGTGTYLEVLAANWEFLKERWFIAIYDGRFLKLTGLFLIGWWTANQQIIRRAHKNQRLLIWLTLIALLIGLPTNLIVSTSLAGVALRPVSIDGLLVETLKAIGIPAMGLGYIALLSLWMNKRPASRVINLLAVVGRISLTNYVMQSVIGVTIFYGYGFQQWGRFGVAWSIPLILAIFALQILLSAAWLNYFRFGPLEWIWRCMAYGKVIPILNQLSGSHQIVAKKT